VIKEKIIELSKDITTEGAQSLNPKRLAGPEADTLRNALERKYKRTEWFVALFESDEYYSHTDLSEKLFLKADYNGVYWYVVGDKETDAYYYNYDYDDGEDDEDLGSYSYSINYSSSFDGLAANISKQINKAFDKAFNTSLAIKLDDGSTYKVRSENGLTTPEFNFIKDKIIELSKDITTEGDGSLNPKRIAGAEATTLKNALEAKYRGTWFVALFESDEYYSHSALWTNAFLKADYNEVYWYVADLS